MPMTSQHLPPHRHDQPASSPAEPGSEPARPVPPAARIRIASPSDLLGAVPYLLGFHPARSLVVIGVRPPRDRVHIVFRYDLPSPPKPGYAHDIAAHAADLLTREHVSTAVAAGYGPGALVTPVAEQLQAQLETAGIKVREILRAEDGRYWSYICREPSCCPPEGVPFDAAEHPVSKAMAAAGEAALPSRDALAASVAPLTGPAAAAMAQETQHAERIAAKLFTRAGPDALDGPGLAAVQAAVRLYRDGGSMDVEFMYAWLALVLQRLRIRDDAWARMDPAHSTTHRRLWTDVEPGYVAAPASLLAVTAWQQGNGALANIALDRALADTPGYSMALLIRDAIDAGAPPSIATPPMTPEQLAASYAGPRPAGPSPAAESG
jgi:hypothetical protein